MRLNRTPHLFKQKTHSDTALFIWKKLEAAVYSCSLTTTNNYGKIYSCRLCIGRQNSTKALSRLRRATAHRRFSLPPVAPAHRREPSLRQSGTDLVGGRPLQVARHAHQWRR